MLTASISGCFLKAQLSSSEHGCVSWRLHAWLSHLIQQFNADRHSILDSGSCFSLRSGLWLLCFVAWRCWTMTGCIGREKDSCLEEAQKKRLGSRVTWLDELSCFVPEGAILPKSWATEPTTFRLSTSSALRGGEAVAGSEARVGQAED